MSIFFFPYSIVELHFHLLLSFFLHDSRKILHVLYFLPCPKQNKKGCKEREHGHWPVHAWVTRDSKQTVSEAKEMWVWGSRGEFGEGSLFFMINRVFLSFFLSRNFLDMNETVTLLSTKAANDRIFAFSPFLTANSCDFVCSKVLCSTCPASLSLLSFLDSGHTGFRPYSTWYHFTALSKLY